MTYENILALDPSGNFEEGKGTTGFCIFNIPQQRIIFWGAFSALEYPCREAYWDAHVQLLDMVAEKYPNLHTVIEDYLLYASKASEQINSKMETPRLIGLLQYMCWKKEMPYTMQNAAEVKTRWANEILLHKEYLVTHNRKMYIKGDNHVPVNRHTIDSIRHAVHFATFKANKKSIPRP